MEAPKPETLMWAEFLWRVATETPEMLLAWITVYIAWEELRARKRLKGHRLILNLEDPETITDSLRPLILPKFEAHGSSSTRMELTAPRPAILSLGPAIGKATTSLELTTGRPLN